jgi:hypothetical protein
VEYTPCWRHHHHEQKKDVSNMRLVKGSKECLRLLHKPLAPNTAEGATNLPSLHPRKRLIRSSPYLQSLSIAGKAKASQRQVRRPPSILSWQSSLWVSSTHHLDRTSWGIHFPAMIITLVVITSIARRTLRFASVILA